MRAPGLRKATSVVLVTETRASTRRVRRLTGHEISSYDHVPSELTRRVWLIRTPRTPGPYLGISLGRFLLMSRDIRPDGASLLLAHELVHVRQWSEVGVVGFTWAYVSQFLSGLVANRNWTAAYRDIDAEREAREVAEKWQKRRQSRPQRAERPEHG